MQVYRLMRARYGLQLSGAGAARGNARWNSKGTAIIYTAESRALAMAEVAVHLSLHSLASDYLMATIDIPDDISLISLSESELPEQWNAWPHQEASRRIGDDFISQCKAAVLKVPSAVVRGDSNYLIHPAHEEFGRIRIVDSHPFKFDKRLIG